MTQEEKARAYDEALEKAKFYHGNCPSEPERKKLEKMFPVLKMNEDERIRKELIFFLKEEIPQCSIKEHANKLKEFVAWLEKQEEQKPADLIKGVNGVPCSSGNQKVDVSSTKWNEKDRDNMNHIRCVIDDCYCFGRHDLNKADRDKLMALINSLDPENNK